MMQLKIEKVKFGLIPCYVVYPIRETGKTVIFYHGWSSKGELQVNRAAFLAVHGYTVFIPDAVNHGERHALSDYYTSEGYDIFWKTIFSNVEEFPFLYERIFSCGYEKPFLMGHSMGGLSILGIAALHSAHLRGIVSFNGSGDWELSHLFMQARFGISFGRNWILYEELEKRNPLNHLSDIKRCPLLLINGECDTSVDPRAQAHFFDAFKKAGGAGAKIEYPGLGHFVTTNMMDDAVAWMETVK